MDENRGLYLGTEVNERWYQRYTQEGLLARGNGEYWFDDKGFYFLRDLTQEPIFISLESILKVKLGTWHSGRYCCGRNVLKIVWKNGDLRLSSGFLVSSDKQEAIDLMRILEAKKEKLKG